MRRFIPWIVLIVVIAAGSLAIWRWAGASDLLAAAFSPSMAAGAIASTPVTKPVSAERLFDPNLDPQSRQSLADKLAMEDRQKADREAGEVNPAPKNPNQGVAAPNNANALAQVPTGIFPGSDAMVKPEEAKINNYWQGLVNGQVVVVLAGSRPDDENKGLVVILLSDGFSLTGYQQVQAPEGTSSLKVVEAGADRLTLQDTQGRKLSFNLSTLAFE